MKTTNPILAAAVAMALAAPAHAGAKQDNEELMEALWALKARVEQLEAKIAAQNEKIAETQATAEEAKESRTFAINDHVEMHGVVEVEASTGDDHMGEDMEDIVLATMELGFDFRAFNDWVTGSVVALHEDDDTDKWEVDVAYATIGNTEEYPMYLSAGRMYVPFGNYSTGALSDPLTLEIGETREAAVQLGFEKNGWYGSAYVFNGDLDERGDDETETWGLNLGYAVENEDSSWDVGIGWINHIGESDGIEGMVGDTDADGAPGPVRDYVAGVSVHGVYSTGPWTFIGEYTGARERFEAAELAWRARGAEPSAYNLEVDYNFEAFDGMEGVVAVALQGTDEAVALELPEHKFLTSVGLGVYDNTTVTVEYAHANDYSVRDGGTGRDGSGLVVQLGVEF